MEIKMLEGSWDKNYPVNWTNIGVVFIEEIKYGGETVLPTYLMIDGVKYEKNSY